MSEGVIGGILGEEDEQPEVEALEAFAGAEAFAAAVAAIASRQDPQVARDTSTFLGDQSALLRVQKRHLEAEHALRLQQLRGQIREGELRRTGMRLRLVFQIFVAVLATALGVGGFLLVRDAVSSRQVVVDPFHAPPGLAARGIDGTVIATGLLDELSRLQDATRASGLRGLTGAWTEEVKLDVPETGLSLGEISRLLRERFGHDIHIYGDLIETPSGLALTVRGNGVPAKIFKGTATELEKLILGAAEYVYAKSQPAPWVSYLTSSSRNEEAIAFSKNVLMSVDPADRPAILSNWANALLNIGGSPREAMNLYRESLRLRPDNWGVHVNLQNVMMVLGDEEGAWKEGEEMRAQGGIGRGRHRQIGLANWDYLTWDLQHWLAAIEEDAESHSGVGTQNTNDRPQIADIQVRLHDLDAAELTLKTSQEDPNDPSGNALIHNVRGRLALEMGDYTTAVIELETYVKAYADPAVNTSNPGYHCWLALAEEATGHPEKADALLNSAGEFVDCHRFRADILYSRGDWAASQKAYAGAVALAPDLPAAYYSWGVALAKHGDLAGAVAKLALANQKGPHWADPLKAWGDVLVRLGRSKDALGKYDQALKYAPNWKQLKDERQALAKKKT